MRPYKIPESVLVVIHTSDLQVLLIERADKPGFWQSVTGSKDAPDEPLVETAIREVFEETGICIGSEYVPMENLRDWKLSNVYEIYEVWRALCTRRHAQYRTRLWIAGAGRRYRNAGAARAPAALLAALA